MNFPVLLRSFAPHRSPAPFAERLRSGIAGGLGIFLLAWALHLLPQPELPLLLLGSMAASAVLLYAVPHSPLAQPWNLIGGHLVSALAGWITISYVHDPLAAAGIAVGAAIFLMYVLDCLHPPGAATALTLVLGASQFLQMGAVWTLTIVGANAFISLLLALSINNALPRRHYPQAPAAPAAPQPAIRVLPEQQDIEQALAEEDSLLDISTEDLLDLYARAQQHAQTRFESSAR
ncbi:MAG: HPP family protein [Gammaproteobacteria bacterium]|nr:HPP family protein [Gammaproteobacteria bacterium]MBU1625659.1 HPP family protein [Gammaproteobacteria bacterium]MBU1980919.1 HPP family protein [Gammaproteobacteria bacterium]